MSGQFSLTTVSYAQDFNTLAIAGSSGVLPDGWSLGESGTNANTTYSTGTGSSSTGDTYSFGAAASAERALGGLRSGTLVPLFGFYFTNNTGSTIISLSIGYSGETWRVGAANRSDRLDFQYSLNAPSLSTGSWTDLDGLDYANPGQATGSGSLQQSAAILGLITGLNIINGATFFIRWSDLDAAGADDGMAIDDLSLMATLAIPTPVMILSFTGQTGVDRNILHWTTVTEINNRGFEVQGSPDGFYYVMIGFVNSQAPGGNSIGLLNYTFADINPAARYYYRLRQVDIDNHSEFSNILILHNEISSRLLIDQLFPNPSNTLINLSIYARKEERLHIMVINLAGEMILQKFLVAGKGVNKIPIDVSKLVSGNYFVKLVCGTNGETSIIRFTKQ